MGRSIRPQVGKGKRNEKPYKKARGTVFVRGFDTKGGLDNVREKWLNKALELDQSKVGGKLINVKEARPRYYTSGPRHTPESVRKEGPSKRARPGQKVYCLDGAKNLQAAKLCETLMPTFPQLMRKMREKWLNKAMELDQSKVGGELINLEEARPRDYTSGPRRTPESVRKEGPGKRARPGSDNRSHEPRIPFGPARPRGPSKPSITTHAKGISALVRLDHSACDGNRMSRVQSLHLADLIFLACDSLHAVDRSKNPYLGIRSRVTSSIKNTQKGLKDDEKGKERKGRSSNCDDQFESFLKYSNRKGFLQGDL
nr:hypothetical protein [Tanacetum cinerariifolium]